MSTTSNSNMKAVLASALLAVATFSSAACGPIVPVSPTWAADVRPLTVARCVRCHDDPKPAIAPAVPFSLNYATFAEIPSTAVMQMTAQVGKAIRGQLAPLRRMPPPPSAVLEDWQMEMLDNWAFHPQ